MEVLELANIKSAKKRILVSQKRADRNKSIRSKVKTAIKKVEADIEAKEQAIAEIDEKLADPAIATNSAKLNELGSLRAKEQEALDELYEQWETLSSELG